MAEQRLQRVLAAYGIASRRKAEQLILAGRVTVDGVVVRELGTKVDPERQEIRVDGEPVRPEPLRYIMLHKPVGYITTTVDEYGRRTVLDLVQVPERVVPVGRLDRDSSGLLLLTNDGDLIYRITHPRYELEKEYEVLVDGFPPPEVEEALRRGVPVDGRPVQIRRLEAIRTEPEGTVYRVVIHEGRNRIIRRVFERVGYPVLRLHRVRVGPLRLGNLPPGQWRDLTPEELAALRRAVGLSETPAGVKTKERELDRGRTVQLRGRDRRPGRLGQKYRRR
ncbi:pseudouridine synthase [Thermomicrobium sp. 4228-Ro]|uniref:pseudouridine synthase n=1 Tax=Thermomicrobium sp. 4228-Ro TaxID=2993937 RepID=UPI0022490CD1|nr:pseudouridine synthase [Thermomicrobium sp. 4228-Ro]MCX2726431.1 pseudouridine synthase [Thermomicrobium sp. 4228-Ro]